MNNISIQEQLNNISKYIDYSNRNRILFIVPESAGDIFLSTSLLPSVKETYSEYDIYFSCKPQYSSILKNNPYIKSIIPFESVMLNQLYMEGCGTWDGFFTISIFVPISAQAVLNYLNNGKTRLGLNLRK